MKIFDQVWKRRVLAGVAVAALLAGGYYGARHYAWPAVKSWRIGRMNRDARAYLDRGDLANALLVARKSLQASNLNPEAWRIGAAASKARQLPEAVYYQENLVRLEATKENYLELIRLTWRFQELGYALEALKTVPPAAGLEPEFHQLAAQIYRRAGQPLKARFHLVTLIGLQPGNFAAQLDLAEFELAADPDRKDPGLRDRIRALATQPGVGPRALTLLLRENVSARLVPGTAELARELSHALDLDFPQKVLVAEAAFLLGEPGAESRLAALQAAAEARPENVVLVMESLDRLGSPGKALPWYVILPEATRKDEAVQRSVAEILFGQRQWPELESLLRAVTWKRNEYLRQALLAHAYRAEGRSADFAEAWKLAVIAASTDIRQANALLARVDQWKWITERYAVIWKLFALVPANESVRKVLTVWEQRQGNTVNLNRLFARIVEVDPADNAARNNFAYTSLLLESNLARAGLMAQELATAEPRNPYFATTYALALFRQGHAAEALARIDALSAAERSEPRRLLLRAVFLAGAGQAAPAAELLNGVTLPQMLPEEKRLAENAAAEIVRLDRLLGNRSRLLAFREATGPESGRVGWLALVAAPRRAAATTDMQLADSLYATAAWPDLYELLHRANWKAAEDLRFALLAFVLRQRGEGPRSQEVWRQALATADRDTARVQDLRALVTQWQWAPERLETLNVIFERNPTDRLLLTELLQNYREARRTADLVRVLGTFVDGTAELTDEAVVHAYYSLLLDSNVAHAHVVARNAFETTPADPLRRQVYAFSLWKQKRNSEARALLAGLKPGTDSRLVPLALIHGVVMAELGFLDDSRTSLAQFDLANALPEERILAERAASRLPTLTVVAQPKAR